MKIALLKFASSFVLGLVDDEAGRMLLAEFGAGPSSVDTLGEHPQPTDEPSLVRLDYPATIETSSWFQQSPVAGLDGAGGQQFVAMRFPVLLEVSRLSCDLGAVEAAEVFDVADSTTAIISKDGVEPAGERLQSSEGLVTKYLHTLETIGVKPKRVIGGRQKVAREP